MKKIQTVLLTLLVACVGMAVQSCNNDEPTTQKYYRCEGYLECVKGYETTFQNFSNELNAAVQSITGQTGTDATVINKVQAVVDKYNNDVLYGTVELKGGALNNPENMVTIKKFVMTANPKYFSGQ